MALTDNLISYWKLEEASGSRADSGGTNHLTDNNTVTQAAGKLGNAAQFTVANSEFLSIADNSSLSIGGTQQFTFSFWAYFDSLAEDRGLLGKWVSAHKEYGCWFSSGTNRLLFICSPDGTAQTYVLADTLGAPSTGTWYHIVVWRSATLLNISVNNGAADTVAYTENVIDDTTAFCLGSIDGGLTGTMSGRIDSVGFWKRALTADERTTLYNSGNGLDYPFTTTYDYPFHGSFRAIYSGVGCGIA